MARATILIVEDELDVQLLLADNLRQEGFDVLTSRSGGEALEMARENRPHLVLLDLMLGDMDGLDVCRELKAIPATRTIPIIMVTAKASEADVVLGFGLGAEDYVTKPFRMKELVARITSTLRRNRPDPEATGATRAEYGPIAVDLGLHEARIAGKPIKTTPTELRILHLLTSRPDVVHSRAEILAHCTAGEEVSDRLVDVYIQLLRSKLGPRRRLIQTVRGVGYRITDGR